jgi:large subunit ribosomal protein L30e
MEMKNLEKIIKEAISSNKCKIGTRQVMGSIRGSKLIVLSNSLMSTNKSKILEVSKSAQVPTLNYDGNSVQLGRLCNKTFRISALSLKIGKENEIQELLSDLGSK